MVLDALNARAAAARACGFRWTCPRRRRPRSAAWRATIRAARARSPTATWSIAWRRSMRGCRRACADASAPTTRSATPAIARSRRRRPRSVGARARRDRRALAEGGPARRRLQPRPARARRTSTSRSSSWAAKARSRGSSASTSSWRELPRHKALGRGALPALPRRDGRRAAHREAGPVRGRAGRPHDARPRALESRRSRHGASAVREGRARRDPAGGVRRRGPRAASRRAWRARASSWATWACRARWWRSLEAARQKALWDVRKAGLNIMMSMKGDGKPVSFIEDCAVPLEHLAEYTAQLTEVFRKHGTRGHVLRARLRRLPARAPGAQHEGRRRHPHARHRRGGRASSCAATRAPIPASTATGSCARSGSRRSSGRASRRALAEIKSWFDPRGLMNPGKIVNPPQAGRPLALPLSAGLPRRRRRAPHSTGARGAASPGAVEMCNNNGHCRKFDAGTMCPSYRATRDERDLTRGRANTLRLALSGQLGARTARGRRRCARRSTCASRARAAGASARPAWTWRA